VKNKEKKKERKKLLTALFAYIFIVNLSLLLSHNRTYSSIFSCKDISSTNTCSKQTD
jgi:hypothetical protein